MQSAIVETAADDDGSLKRFLSRTHEPDFDWARVPSEFAHATYTSLGANDDGLTGNGRNGITGRKTAGCGNCIDRVQKAYSCR